MADKKTYGETADLSVRQLINSGGFLGGAGLDKPEIERVEPEIPKMSPSAVERLYGVDRPDFTYLEPGERNLFNPSTVEKVNAVEEQLAEQNDGSTVTVGEKKIRFPRGYGNRYAPLGSARDIIDKSGATKVPLSYLSGDTDRKSFVVANYPTLAGAMQAAGLTEAEARDAVNFTLAYDAAQRIATSVNPARQRQLLNTMSLPMQALVIDIINKKIEDQKEKQSQLQTDSTGNAITDTGKTVWNWTIGPTVDALMAANEATQRGARTLMLASGSGWQDAWDSAEKGQYDPEYVQSMRDQYGDLPVDIILEIQRAKQNGDPDFLGTLLTKYQDNTEALSIIDSAINGIKADQGVQNMITELLAGETGNTGNLVAWSIASNFGVNPYGQSGRDFANSAAFTGIRDITNVSTTVLLDPTLFAGKIRGAYLSARYGLHTIAAGNTATVFAKPAVRRFFDTLGSQMARIDELESAGEGGKAAQVANSIESSYKRFFTPEALQEMRTAGVRDAVSAASYFEGAENVSKLVVGQSMKRASQITVPHMMQATALVKRASLAIRGMTYERLGAERYIDAIFGDGVSAMMPEDAAKVIAQRINEPGGDRFVGRVLGDFVYADGEGRRTFVGRIMDRIGEAIPSMSRNADNKFGTAVARYGWKREGGVRATRERIGRLLAIYPDDSNPLTLTDGRDAGRIRQLAQLAGMPRYWANYVGRLWAEADEGTRQALASGLGRTYGYARGVDLVDPVHGETMINRMVTGIRPGEQYAADTYDLTVLRGQAERMVEQTNPRLSGETVRQYRERVRNEVLDVLENNLIPNAPLINPSRMGDQSSAIFLSDATNRVAFPNISALDKVTARSSFLSAMLGTNAGITKLTDLWVIGTLAGPRFQVRSGIEDAGLFIGTGGSPRGMLTGRQFSTARREATRRDNPITRREMVNGRELDVIVGEGEVKGMKLGIIKTLSRSIGDHVRGSMQALVLPHLSREEIARVNALSAEGAREPLAHLIGLAFLRQRLAFVWNAEKKGFIFRPQSVEELGENSKLAQQTRYLQEAVEYGDALRAMDDVAETPAHLADGSAPFRDTSETMVIDGVEVRAVRLDANYVTREVSSNDPETIRAWWIEMSKSLHGDGPKGQLAVSRYLRRWHSAQRSNNAELRNDIIESFANDIEAYEETWHYARDLSIAAKGGYRALAEATLRNVERLFTTRSGALNSDLLNRIRRVETAEDGTQYATYALWDIVDGEKVFRLPMSDLAQMNAVPRFVNVADGAMVPVSSRLPMTSRIWNAMGRSLARMTREPIFTANYLESRNVLAPFEARLAETVGERAAAQWAVKAATERSYKLTLNYVDNPAIRSQAAWNLRNVARFYRALEDFNRRMVRVTKNQPMTFWRFALGWNVLEESGFTWTDEYGEKYFVWPGSRVGFEAINGLMNALGVGNLMSPSLPLQFTSRVNMLTPSADPNSWFPTFSGPYAAMTIRPLMRIFPGLKNLEDEFFGTYSTSATIVEGLLPPNVIRALEFIKVTRTSSEALAMETDTMFASSARAAIQAYVAAGLFDPGKEYTPKELSKIQQRLDMTAISIVGIKTLLSPVIPAAMSLSADTVTNYARSLDLSSLRKEYLQVLKANDGDIDKATVIWFKMNPDLSPFTISASTMPDDAGYFGPFKETIDWINQNEDLVSENPIGASFFAPQDGTQTLAAWSMLTSMGLKSTVNVDTYLKKVLTAQGMAEYRILSAQRDEMIADGRGKEANAKFEVAMRDLKARYPSLEAALNGSLSTGTRKSGTENKDIMAAAGDALNVIASKGKLDERTQAISDVISLYNQALDQISIMDQSSFLYDEGRRVIRSKWKNAMEDYGSRFPDDRVYQSLINVASSALGFEVR